VADQFKLPVEQDLKDAFSEPEKQLATVVNAFAYSRSFYSHRFIKYRTYLRHYFRIADSRPPFRSNLFVPLTYSMISTVLPRMVANNPSFRFEPREESDQDNVDQMSSLVKYQLDRMDFFKKSKMWVKDALLFGVGVLKVFWNRYDEEEINDPDVQVVDVFDFFPDPKAVDIDHGDFMIHRTIVPFSYLKKAKKYDGKPLYKNLNKIDKGTTNEQEYNKLFLTNDRQMTIADIDARLIMGTPYRQSSTKQVELLEYYGIYGPNDEEWVITVANRNVVIRAEKNPYPNGKRPFVKVCIDPNNFLFYGTGIADVLENTQIALNDTRNQRMDNINLILNKLFLVVKDANVNEQDLISRPGGVIYTDLPNGVTLLDTPDVTQSAYEEESILKQDAQEAIGVSDIVNGQLQDVGGASKSEVLNKTAKGAQIAVEQAGSKFKYYMQNIEDAMRELGKKLYQYNQEFMTDEKVIRVLAPNGYEQVKKQGLLSKIKPMLGLPVQKSSPWQFVRVKPDAIRNVSLDVQVESGSTQPIEESLKQQKIVNLINLLASLPVTTGETFMAMAEEILKTFSVPNKDQIMKTLQVPQGGAPKASVSVSLKGDLNPYETADIAKQLGASPQSTDPKLVASLDAQDRHDEVMDKVIDHASVIDQKKVDQLSQIQNGQSGQQTPVA
jgi:hypothetical protein